MRQICLQRVKAGLKLLNLMVLSSASGIQELGLQTCGTMAPHTAALRATTEYVSQYSQFFFFLPLVLFCSV